YFFVVVGAVVWSRRILILSLGVAVHCFICLESFIPWCFRLEMFILYGSTDSVDT
ncbi:7302_t:CDS:1, partial [Gigaspora rosea]